MSVKIILRVKKSAKPEVTAAAHPKYREMIVNTLTSHNDKIGSSCAAILKHIIANKGVNAAKAPTWIRLALKRGVSNGTLKMAHESGKDAGCLKIVRITEVKKDTPANKIVKNGGKKPDAKKVVQKYANLEMGERCQLKYADENVKYY